jgi:pimeloyl-ACP methyl ester carboxylesterase
MRITRLLALSLALVTALAACSQEKRVPVDQLVDLGTHSLHVRCVGRGSPVIVIDTGHGDVAAKWYAIQDQLAADSRVCTYDRAGYGRSEQWPVPRHCRQAAIELKLLLENAGVKGPYLLVGHSLGGMNVQIFADDYPDLVAGLVLVDPPPVEFLRAPPGAAAPAFPELYEMLSAQAAELAAASDRAARSPEPQAEAEAAYLGAIASELRMLVSGSADQVAAVESFGDTPLVVIAAGQPNPAFGEQADAFQQFWIEQNRALAQKSTDGEFVRVAESGHLLYEDAPERVVEAVRRVLERARSTGR